MSSFFADLLAQKQPQFQTHQALIVVGLQNDFCSPAGKLPVTQPPALLDRIKSVVPIFREHAGHVIWVRTELNPNQPVPEADDEDAIIASVPGESASSDDDNGSSGAELTLDDLPSRSASRQRQSELLKRIQARVRRVEKGASETREDELFLTQGSERQICMAGSWGAEWADDVAAEIKPEDTLVVKHRYSALKGTTLLLTLRAKLITELYVCGCISNISVYATAAEAARHGIEIYLVDDCVGYRQRNRHREAIQQMVEYMGAHTISSAALVSQLTNQTEKGDTSQGRKPATDDDLGDMLKNLKLKDKDGPRCSDTSSAPRQVRPPGPSRHQDAVAVSANPLEVADSDDALLDETTLLLERHSIRSRPPETPPRSSGSVKSKVRVRRKPADRSDTKQKENEKTSPDSPKNGQTTVASAAKLTSREASSSEKSKTPTSEPKTPRSAENKAAAETTGSLPAKKPNTSKKSRRTQSLATLPTLGPSDIIGEGDSRIVHNFLPQSLRASATPEKALEEVIFDKLYNEVRWQKMMHAEGEVPRLVSVQGELGADGSMPVYRHPSDQSLPLLHFSPAVLRVRKQVEELVQHPINHVLIQLYRGGQDYISEHSDKTLDIVRGSSIVNVSFGAQRTMRLRTKRSAPPDQANSDAPPARQTQRVSMPHNSVFVLGPQTNMRWLHGINADKRPSEEKSESEREFCGMRISLTFRHIGTFLSNDSSQIWGQGATSKTKAAANPVTNGDQQKTDALIRAFGTENQTTAFDWASTYGSGSDVLHFRHPPPETPILYTSHSPVEHHAVSLYLQALNLPHALVEPPPPRRPADYDRRPITFRDTDPLHTEVCGAVIILAHLDSHHTPDAAASPATRAAVNAYLSHAHHLFRLWTRYLAADGDSSSPPSPTDPLTAALAQDLAALEDHRAADRLRRRGSQGADGAEAPSVYLAGPAFSVADAAIWPLVNALLSGRWSGERDRWPCLVEYWRGLAEVRADVKALVEREGEEVGTAVGEEEKGKGKA